MTAGTLLSPDPATVVRRGGLARAILSRRVHPADLIATLTGLLAVDQLLLWRFLGLSPLWMLSGGIALVASVTWMRRLPGWSTVSAPSVRTLALCSAIALVLYTLGGEGRFLYANTDWQVRGAVLRDLVIDRWPFVYDVAPAPLMLRAPLGMYLLPAMVGKLMGLRAAEIALLLQHSAMLGMTLALGSSLFAPRARALALLVIVGFSGMDLLGVLIAHNPNRDYIDAWMQLTFSSHVDQAFWVPQHALAGWIGALLYMSWRDRLIPRAALLAPLPLLALWSPLALIGLVPLAAHAGFDALATRRLKREDVLLPALSCVAAAPSLLYLAAASGTVGGSVQPLDWVAYSVFELIEAGPYLIALALLGRHQRFGAVTSMVVTASLLLAPLGQVGSGADFVMRASIPALAILSVLIATILTETRLSRRGRLAQALVAAAFTIGLATPYTEIRRTLVSPPSPTPLCSYLGVVPGGAAHYVARYDRVPILVRPSAPAPIRPADPVRCWDGPWPDPLAKYKINRPKPSYTT